MSHEGEVLVRLARLIGLALLAVLGDGVGDAGDDRFEQHAPVSAVDVDLGLVRHLHQAATEHAVLAHQGREVEADPEALYAVLRRGGAGVGAVGALGQGASQLVEESGKVIVSSLEAGRPCRGQRLA